MGKVAAVAAPDPEWSRHGLHIYQIIADESIKGLMTLLYA